VENKRKQKLRIRLNRNIDDLYVKMVEYISEIKTTWVYNEINDEYETEVRNLKIIIGKDKAEIKLKGDDDLEEGRTIRKKKGQKALALYETLTGKFNEHDEYTFYNKVCRVLNEQKQRTAQKKDSNGITLSESTDS